MPSSETFAFRSISSMVWNISAFTVMPSVLGTNGFEGEAWVEPFNNASAFEVEETVAEP